MKSILTAALFCTAAAYAQVNAYTVNASQIVTGTMVQNVPWVYALANQNNPLPSQYENSTLSSVWHDQLPLIYLGNWMFYRPAWYAGNNWAPQWSVLLQQPYAAERDVPTQTSVSGNVTTYYSNPYVVKAAVDFPNLSDVQARVANGTAHADLSYRVMATNTSGQTADYYISLPTPKLTRKYSEPYSYNNNVYAYPNYGSAASMSAFEIYVDGLPVFSQSSMLEHPKLSADAHVKLETAFGPSAIPNPTVLIYLGKIPANNTFTVDMVVRAEATAAATCGTSFTNSFGQEYITKQCLDLTETAPIPVANSSIALKVFALAPLQ